VYYDLAVCRNGCSDLLDVTDELVSWKAPSLGDFISMHLGLVKVRWSEAKAESPRMLSSA
jgi:hypothetical protein